MSTDRRSPTPRPFRADGRYLRFSHRYNTWQVKTAAGDWRNLRQIELVRAYAAMGFPIGSAP